MRYVKSYWIVVRTKKKILVRMDGDMDYLLIDTLNEIRDVAMIVRWVYI